jgi:hypothetical protein
MLSPWVLKISAATSVRPLAAIASARRPCSRSIARLAGICPTKRPASEKPVWIATRPRRRA